MNVNEALSPHEIQEYLSQGYTMQDIQTAVDEAANQPQDPLQASYMQTQQQRHQDPRAFASQSSFANKYNENLIQWQLELDSILERVEHMLKGDEITFKEGSIFWKSPTNPDNEIFNNYGVAEIMRILSLYLNRNTILSNYKEEDINVKMYDLGNELADLIFLKYEDMGLDSLEKRKLYPMLVRQIVDVIHSSYLRALHGGERESLRESRQVTQSENLGMGGVNINTSQQRKERGLLNPLRWISGKYV